MAEPELPNVTRLSDQACFEAQGGLANGLSWSPDGRRLAIACEDGAIRIWDGEAASLVRTIAGHQAAVTSVSFSPDGKKLASASKDSTVRVWTDDGRQLHCFSGPTTFRGVAWDALGHELLALQTKRIHLWNTREAGGPRILFEHDKLVRKARWIGRDRVVSCGEDGRFMFWDTTTLRPVARTDVDPAGLVDLDLLGDGPPLLAFAGRKGMVHVWRSQPFVSHQETFALTGANLLGIAVSAGGKLLAGLDAEGCVHTMLPASGTRGASARIRPVESPRPTGALIGFHPSRPILAVLDAEQVRLFRCEPLQYERAASLGLSPSLRLPPPASRVAAGPGAQPREFRQAEVASAHAVPRPEVVGMPLPRRVFFSYARADRERLNELLTILQPLVRSGEIEPWVDTAIVTGDWNAQIDDAMRTSSVAVLLVSAEFMASKFINSTELPTLLALARERKVDVVWLMLSPAIVEPAGLLALQCFRDSKDLHHPGNPLLNLSRAQRRGVLTEFCQYLARVVAARETRRSAN